MLINRHADLLSDKIWEQTPDLQGEAITWLSPLESDEFAEYRDGSFLARLGLEGLSAEFAKFWPRRGPQWDVLGMTSQGSPLLVEAKANVPELISHCGAKDPNSLRLIATVSKRRNSGWPVGPPRTGRDTSISTQIVWPISTSYENSRGKMPSLSSSTLSMTSHTFPHHSRNGVGHCSYRRS